MAITPFVGNVAESNDLVSVTPTLSTVPQPGDLICVLIAWRNGGSGIIDIAGYTQKYKVFAAARSLHLWYKVAVGGEGNPIVSLTGGLSGNVIAACVVVLRSSESGKWAWGAEGPTYQSPAGSTNDIGPISPATGATSSGCVFFSGFKNAGDATNVAALSGDGLTWTRFANHFTLTGSDLSFVGSLGRWSGSRPTLTEKTFVFTDGSVPANGGQLGQSALVNEVRTLEAAPAYATLVAQNANISQTGRGIQPSTGYAASIAQNALFTRLLRTTPAVGYAAARGQKATLVAARSFQVARGSASLVGRSADLTLIGLAQSLDALGGYALVQGQKSTISRVLPVSLTPGYGILVGQKSELTAPRGIHPAPGYGKVVGISVDVTLLVPEIITGRAVSGNDMAWTYSSEDGVFGDLGVDGTNAPAWSGDLRSDIIVSIGTDARAAESDFIPDGTTDRRGWWGDLAPANDLISDEFGSLFWLLSREKQLPSVLVRVREYASRALQWIVDDGIAERVNVDASFPRMGWVELRVEIHRPASPPVRYRFDIAWNAQAASGAE